MMKSCPYCAQTETRKDKYGYCKKHSCFYVSGTKDKLDDLKKEYLLFTFQNKVCHLTKIIVIQFSIAKVVLNFCENAIVIGVLQRYFWV